MPNVRSEICEITLKEIVGNLSNKPASKIVHEWNCGCPRKSYLASEGVSLLFTRKREKLESSDLSFISK